MKLYVINLDRSSDRLARLKTIFSRLNLTLTRVKAIDARKLDDKTYEAVNAINLWPDKLTRGEVACFLSHKTALAQIAAGADPFGVVFEDDVELAECAGNFLKNSDWVPSDADIVKLETFFKKVWLGPKQATSTPGFMLEEMKSSHIMAAGYLISKQAAARFIDKMERKSAPFDHLLFNFRLHVAEEFKIYQLDPAIVVQARLESTLQSERTTNETQKKARRGVIQTVVREMRRLFSRARTGLWGITINTLSHDQWKRIPFANPPKTGKKK